MFREINLELGLKAFKDNSESGIARTVESVFDCWRPLLKGREQISILLWASDGSNILDYKGNLDEEIEWGYFLGCAKQPTLPEGKDKDVNLHLINIKFMKQPPVFTHRILKNIVERIKSEGAKRYPEAKILVGLPFDIGPEFAKSDFKYHRHNEICTGLGEGGRTFVNSTALLDADDYPYAGYPDGIPQGTPFGTFLGRQTKCYFEDLGVDYLWLSNGVGFSESPWNSTGEIFDGEAFHTDKLEKTQKSVMTFWHNFRKECPDYKIYTRGTNYTAGMDYATDGVALENIYKSGLNIVPPPNSPWGAINYNFGLELAGHLTRNCLIPEDRFMYRFYLHDCWWINSPWYDRYNQSPYDIYLPMALARIDEDGTTCGENILNVFTLENSFGDMPENCVNEVIPHLLRAEKDSPDEPGAFVWIYPFEQYMNACDEWTLREMLKGDLFAARAIGNGFPLSAISSCGNFIKQDKAIYGKSILFTPVPEAGSEFEEEILNYSQNGGRVIYYGALDKASEKFLKFFDMDRAKCPKELTFDKNMLSDCNRDGKFGKKVALREEINGECGAEKCGRFRLDAEHKNSVWYFAPLELDSLDYDSYGIAHIDNPAEYVWGTVLLRKIIETFGYEISFDKAKLERKLPVIMTSRSNNAEIFSVYCPDQTVETRLKFPLGAPILDGFDVEIRNGKALYRFAKSVHAECRVFVEMENGTVSVAEKPPVSRKFRRRIAINGLENATVRIFGEKYCEDLFDVKLGETDEPYRWSTDFGGRFIHSKEYGTYFEAVNVTGNVLVSMPYKDEMPNNQCF